MAITKITTASQPLDVVDKINELIDGAENNINTLLTSGTITLVDNSVNTITPTGKVIFKLPNITDNATYHKILVQVNLINVYSIELGTYYCLNDSSVDISTAGVYDIFYEYDKANQYWVVECKKKQKPKGAMKIIASDATTGAIKYSDESLWACGSYTSKKVFTNIMSDAKDVVFYGNGIWILKKDNTLWGKGSNTDGEQGSGDTTDVTVFTQRLEDVSEIKATGRPAVSNTSTTWALKTDGTLWSCGANGYGQQGDGEGGSGAKLKTFTQKLSNVSHFVCNPSTTWVLKTDGTLYGCGNNQYGNQGDGGGGWGISVLTFTQRLSNVKQIAASYRTTFALKADGTLWGCGEGTYGQMGQGDTNSLNTFTQLASNVAYVACSATSTWIIKTDNTLWGCGANSSGQQGSGDTTDVTTFTQRLEDVAKVCCDDYSDSYGRYGVTWVLKNDNTLWGCGENRYGQQGDGDTTDVTSFTQRLADVTKFTCTYKTTWAAKKDGTLWGCGNNSYGQQGDNTTTDVSTFTQRSF